MFLPLAHRFFPASARRAAAVDDGTSATVVGTI
jgi:hypothetical protein